MSRRLANEIEALMLELDRTSSIELACQLLEGYFREEGEPELADALRLLTE